MEQSTVRSQLVVEREEVMGQEQDSGDTEWDYVKDMTGRRHQ